MEPEHQEMLDSLRDDMTIPAIGIVVAVLVLAVGVHYLRSWYRGSDGPADDSEKFLEQMRELQFEGDLSEKEFRFIQSQLNSRTEI